MGLKFRSPIVRTQKVVNTKGVNKGMTTNGFQSRFIGYSTPTWVNVKQQKDLANIYSSNPVAYAVITLKANMASNAKINVRDLKSGEIFTKDTIKQSSTTNKTLINKALRLMENPNVLQSRKEFITMSSIIKDTFGNQFTYFNTGSFIDIRNVVSLWNIYPQYMNVLLQGNYYNATNLDEIIKQWKWGGLGGNDLTFEPEEILLRKSPNVKLNNSDDLIFGMSPLVALREPLSNIALSYESQNVVLKNRGARLLISLARQQDQVSGVEPAEPADKDEVQEDWDEYGLREGQRQAFITRMPIDVTVIDQDIRKLGIFETIANNAMNVNNAYGIANDLLPLWIKGSTFENQKEAEKRTYTHTIIPEFDDWLSDIDTRLQMEKFGMQYIANFDHIPALQIDKKENALANNITSKYHQDLFLNNLIVANVWLQSLGIPADETIGNKRLSEFTESDLRIIGILKTDNTNQNGSN